MWPIANGTENRNPNAYFIPCIEFVDVELGRLPAMSAQPQRIGVAAITENLLKRKWSSVILRHVHQGLNDPVEIAKIETEISAKVMSERLRTMVRYGLIARTMRTSPPEVIEYRLTALGTKILEMIDHINALDEQFRQGRFSLGRKFDETSGASGLMESTDRNPFLIAPHSNDLSAPP